jgi:hypothetical protein
MDLPASVANKRLTVLVSPLDATYKKQGGGSRLWLVNQESDKDFLSSSDKPCLTIGSDDRPVPIMSGHESRVTSRRVAPLSSECYDLVFHDPC